MNKILFVCPSKSIGGINSSLSSIISNLSTSHSVDVMALSSFGSANYDFLENAYTSTLLDAYFSDFKELRGIKKLYSIGIKIIKRISYFLHISFEDVLLKYVAKRIQDKHKFDVVVGFSEGKTMRFTSWFNVSKKFTWIHCEYDRAVPIEIDELKYYQKFHRIVCVSNFTRERFVSRYPSLDSTTITINNLLDVDRIISLSNKNIDDIRFDTDKYTIISVGRMHPVKRFSMIPKIAQDLKDRQLSFVWYIIGGPLNDEYNKLLLEIDRCNVGDCVILLGEKANPYPYFKKSQLYVSTSISEACPMVFNEASLLNLPIVTSDFGSAYEFVTDEDLIEPIDRIADGIYAMYSKNVNKDVNDIYSRDKIAKETINEIFA